MGPKTFKKLKNTVETQCLGPKAQKNEKTIETQCFGVGLFQDNVFQQFFSIFFIDFRKMLRVRGHGFGGEGCLLPAFSLVSLPAPHFPETHKNLKKKLLKLNVWDQKH